MEDRRLPIVLGQGAGARTVTLDLPPFTLIGATTRTGLLTTPLRDRFGVCHRLEHYGAARPPPDRPALRRHPRHRDRARGGARRSPARSRGTPRVANRLLRRVRDFAEVRGAGVDRRRASPPTRSSCSRSIPPASTASTARPANDHQQVRRRPGRPVDARGRGRRGAGHDRGRLRALPAAAGPDQAHAAGPRAHRAGLRAPRAAGSPRAGAASSKRRDLTIDGRRLAFEAAHAFLHLPELR